MDEKWASSAPVGFSAFALVCLVIGLSLHGLIPKENLPVFFALLTAGGLAQIIAGVIELKRGIATRGNLLMTFGTLFMIGPALTFLLVGMKLATPAPLLGYVNILLGIFMGIYMIPLVRAPFMVFFVGPLGFVVLSMLGFVEIGYHSLAPFTTFLFYVAVCWGLYMMAQSLGEAVGIHLPLGKPLIPMPRPAVKEPDLVFPKGNV